MNASFAPVLSTPELEAWQFSWTNPNRMPNGARHARRYLCRNAWRLCFDTWSFA